MASSNLTSKLAAKIMLMPLYTQFGKLTFRKSPEELLTTAP